LRRLPGEIAAGADAGAETIKYAGKIKEAMKEKQRRNKGEIYEKNT